MSEAALETPGPAALTGSDRLSNRDFSRLAAFIHDYSGIKMPSSKRTMVEGRLRKRLRAVGSADLTEYCRHLFERGGMDAEAVHLIDAVTTNKTEFFREPQHFRDLIETCLPELLATRSAGGPPTLKIWSAASSIGAEAYTLAMVLADAASRLGGFRFSILGTDIATKVLKTAAMAIYPEEMIEPVPAGLRRSYLLRSRDRTRKLVRIAPELRRQVKFARINLMEAPYAADRDMDVIFCRNILIYFDKPTQQLVLERLCDHLRPGGFLFLGHSESLTGLGLPVAAIGNTVFRRL